MRIHEIPGQSDIDRLQMLHRKFPTLHSARLFFISSVEEQFTPGTPEHRAILLAVVVSSRTHKNETRKSGELYFRHPLMVALRYMIRTEKWDHKEIIVRVLHDVIEDGTWTFSRIHKMFGLYVAYAVWSLSRPKHVLGLYIDTLRHGAYRLKLLFALSRVVEAKIDDVGDNLTDLFYMPVPHRKKKLKEARRFYRLLATLRLGRASVDELSDAIAVAHRMHKFLEEIKALEEQATG